MTNNCLTTTLQGNASIENPQYLGELRFELKDMQQAQSVQLVSFEPGTKFKVIGGHFENNQGADIGDTITTINTEASGYGGFYKVMKDVSGAVLVYPKYETRMLRASNTVFAANSIDLDKLEGSSIINIYGYSGTVVGSLKHLPSSLTVLSIYDSTGVTGKLSDLIKYTALITILVNHSYIDIDVPLKDLYQLDQLSKINAYPYGKIEDFVALQIAKKNRTSCESLDIVWPSHQLTFNGVDAASGSENNYLSWAAGGVSGQYNLTYNSTTITIAVNSDGTWSKVS